MALSVSAPPRSGTVVITSPLAGLVTLNDSGADTHSPLIRVRSRIKLEMEHLADELSVVGLNNKLLIRPILAIIMLQVMGKHLTHQ